MQIVTSMLESLAKLLETWFGNPIRGLTTMMLSSIIVIALWRFQPFAEAMKDSFWRWPFLALVVSSTGLITYPVAHFWKLFEARRHTSSNLKKCVMRLSDLTPHEKHVLKQYLQDENRTLHWAPSGGTIHTLALLVRNTLKKCVDFPQNQICVGCPYERLGVAISLVQISQHGLLQLSDSSMASTSHAAFRDLGE